MTAPLERMRTTLTEPFRRGADTLTLALQPVAADVANVADYDFAEHTARFGDDPDPRYVVTALADVAAPTRLTIGYETGDRLPRTTDVTVAAGTVAGTGFVVRLGADEGSAARLRTVTVAPAAAPPAGAWRVTALLGHLARLLWVLSRERATLDRHAGLLRDQGRDVDRAEGVTLDLLGFDLGVPRFPALPYGFEDRTIALYHFDDADGAPIADAAALYTGGAGHPGTAVGARARAPGRFGPGFAFDTAAAHIEIAHTDDLATGESQDLTVECFVRPDVATGEGAVVSKHADPADPALAGWALSVGDFGRGVPRNVRFLVTAGGGPATLLHADKTLPTARFSHVAGVVDRTAGAARLLVDGSVVASAPFTGALTNQAAVLIGRAGADAAHAFSGGVDEVRLSAAARTAFAPVLGESDDGYRRRLKIFRLWTLPTPAGLTDALADAVPELHGVSRPLHATDVDATLVQAARTLLVEPEEIPVGATADDVGARGVDQGSAAGRPEDDIAFDRALLVDATDTGARFPPGGPSAADARLMRVGTRAALRALADLVVAAGGRADDLAVTGGYDPAAPDLRAVGRALNLHHATVATGALAGLALRAGFTHVAHRGNPDDVVAAVRDTASVEIVVDGGAVPSTGFDGLVGGTATLRVDPTPPPGATLRWSTINCGDGRAGLVGRHDRPSVTLTFDRPGRLVLEVAVGHDGRTVTGTRALRVGVAELAAGASITTTGAPGGAEPAVVAPDEVMHPAYLVDVDPAFGRPPGAPPETRRVHPAMAERLALLATLLPAGSPSLVEAWNPAAPGPGGRTPAHVGRSVTLGRGTSTATPTRLAALAHAAGISWVGTDGTTVRLVQEPGTLAPIHGPDTVGEGTSADLSVVRAGPRAVAVTPDRVWTLNAESATVSELDATGAVRACVKVGVTPVAIAAAPDGSRVLTADAGEVSLSLVRTSGGAVTRLPVPTPPVDVVHHPTAARAYAALTASTGDIVELDLDGAAVLRTVRAGSQVVAVRCAPGGDRLWAVTTKPELCRVDLTTFTVTARVALDARPADLAVGAQRAYVTEPSAGTLVVVDLATRRIVARFTDAGTAPTRLALDPAGTLLYVVDPVEGRVRLRAADGSPRDAPGLPAARAVAGVTAVAASADRAYLATGGAAADAVTVLEPAGAALVAAWPLGTGLGEGLVWSVRVSGGAAATLTTSTHALTALTGVRAGPAQVRAVYRWPNAPGPYKVRIEPAQALLDREATGLPTVIQRDQFDLVMNVLNHLCPVGVEVDTSAVRDRVVELRAGLLEALPPHTYPDFRARGPRPPTFRFGNDDGRPPTTGETS